MSLRTSVHLAGMAALIGLAAAGCSRNSGPLRPWPLSTDPIVFEDNFTGAVVFEAFGNSKLDALNVDAAEQYLGSACLRFTVPNPGSGYAGGAFVASQQRDLSGYNALTFYAKASRPVTLDIAGLGNDNTGTSKHQASRSAIPLQTIWQKYVIPIPLPSKLAAERGLFFLAASPQGGAGYSVWFDEVKFDLVGMMGPARPSMTPLFLNSIVGATTNVTGTRDTFNVSGTDLVVDHFPGYFTFASSNPGVATVANGAIRIVGEGTASITARLDTTRVAGAVTVNAGPFTPGLAPTPTVPASDVISLFSDAYSNRPVDTWSATWDVASVTDLNVSGNNKKLYTNMLFAGIEFISRPADATAMKYFHMDIWVPSGTLFKVKLVEFNSDGTLNSQRELSFDANSTPPLVTGSWIGLEIPLANFMDPIQGLFSRNRLSQLVISGDTRTVYVDNIYFHR